MEEQKQKEELAQAAHIISKAKQFYLFCKKFWWAHAIIATFAAGGVKQYYTLSAIEKEFKPLQDSVKIVYRSNDSLKRVIFWMKEHQSKQDSRLDDDDKYIDNLFDWKQPYGKWGNAK